MNNKKKGVSLVTVLLFMLVATIAATATFKWLNSEGQSSASRMMLAEARQSAEAGIESARSWMTYHGNETGAIIKQYFKDNKAPISLDSLLSPMTHGQQSFSVKVVGVDVSNATYKIKLASTGTARNGTTFSEEAVLKVTGLYRVAVPSTKSALEFNYALFTSSITYEGTNNLQSAVINGDWTKNPPITTGDFIVTGNASLSGSALNIGGTACIGGDLKADNGITSTNLYVRGKTSGTALSISNTGSTYLDGPLSAGDQAISFNHLTINDTINTKLQSNSFTVNGDFCVDERGFVNNNSNSRAFTVHGNVWIPATHIPFLYNGSPMTSDKYSTVVLGDDDGDQIYVQGATPSSSYASFRESKKIEENSSYKKNCPSGFQREGGWVWNGSTFVFNGTGNYNTCGTQAYFSPSYGNVYAEYKKGWNNWGGSTYYPYDAVTEQNDMYYIYYNDPGVTDVEFKEYPNDYWWYYTGGSVSGVSAPSGGIVLELDRAAFKNHFSSPTPVGAYFVGGQLYYDTYSVYNYYHYENNKPTASPYCYKGSEYQPKCAVAPWFKALGTVKGTLPSTKPESIMCGSSAKDHCDSIWTEKAGCDGSKYKVDDPLITALSAFEAKANNLECSKNITSLGNPGNSELSKLDSCYNKTVANADSATKLYNGFLVVKFSSIDQNAAPTYALNGKFIIIVENKPSNYLKLGPSNGITMIYLKKGAPTIYPSDCNSKQTYKYFIYSAEDIDMIGGFNETNCQIQGTVFATSNGCKKVKSANGNSGEFLKTDASVIDALGEASAICPAQQGTCGGAISGEGAAGVVTTMTYSGFDTDYISTGTQLKIELESQYKNEETYAEAEDVSPSIMVLPRLVYLNQDAIGKLSDYYTVLPLNGAEITGNGSVSCPAGAPPTSGNLTASGDLNGGFYYCTYTENGYSSSFHIVVSGKLSETPFVRFSGDSDAEELNGFVDNERKLNLIISGVTAATSTPFTVNIAVSKADMHGWTLTPTTAITKVSESGGTTIYSYTGALSTSEQTIEAFTLTTASGAQTGSVSFMLQNPSNCIVTSPQYKVYSITGSATVKRASLKEYCSLYPDNCKDDGAEFGIVMDHEDCDEGGEWVSANGDGCGTEENNKIWKCAAGGGNPLFLEAKTYDNSLCKAYIPSRDNVISTVVDDEVNPDGFYTLYASLKKRMYTLHVSLSGATDGKVVVRSKANASGSFEESGTCETSSGCDFSFYAGRYVQIEAVQNLDKFSYWTCLSGRCSSVNSTANPLQIIMDGNYDYEAKFNEIDPHCFYTDFSNVKAFCNNSDETECIDKCEGSSHCVTRSGAYGETPDWLMTYANKNGNTFISPDFYGGYASYSGSTDNGNQTILLSRTIAGNNGTMTARIMTENLSSGKASTFVNNGFIIRSNSDASSFIVLNIYGKDGYGSYARICYAEGQSVSSTDNCVEKQLKTSSESSPSINGSQPVNATIDVNGNKIDVQLSFQSTGSSASVKFNLTDDWDKGDLNDLNHRYMGLMLTDREFRVNDIGWRALDFPNETCFDYPSVSCSFASNFLGGKVPLATDVEPWVGFSSWFSDHGDCTTKTYYYNGCDVSNFESRGSDLSAACVTIASDGLYEDTLARDGLKLSGNYNFELEGMHGVPGTNNVGRVRNAFVSVTCDGTSYTSTSCGEFYVGEMNECSRNEILINSSTSGSDYEKTVGFDSPVNLRAATLMFNFESLADGEHVEITLEDSEGKMSRTRSVTITNHDINVEDFLTLSTFNPERVQKIHLTGSAAYTLRAVTSNCPNAVNIGNCTASYSGSQWAINTEITHVENALKCRVKPNSSDITGSDDFVECSSMRFSVSDPYFYDRFNSGSDDEISYDFTVEVFDVAEPAYSDVAVASCVATSETYKHVKAECSIDKQKVTQKGGVPTLTYSIQNCPDYGCQYSVELDGKATRTNNPAVIPQTGVTGETWTAPVNTNDENELYAPASYTYKVTAYNNDRSKIFADCSSDDLTFDVEEMKDVTGTCSISGSYLNVEITGANYGEASEVSLVSGDVLGNILNFSSIAVGESQTASIDLSARTELTPGLPYAFVLNLPSGPVTCGSYTKPYEISLTCPANVTNQKAEEALTVTPTVSGCGSACSWSLTGGSVSLSGTDYNGGALTPFTSEGSDGTTVSYTIQLSRTGAAESKSCTFTVQYRENTDIKGTCSTLNGFVPAKITNIDFSMRNLTDVNISRTVYIDGNKYGESSNCNKYYCEPMEITLPSTIGTYTYQLRMGTDVLCTGTLNAKSPLSCSVSSNEVPYNQKFTFTGTRVASGCHNCQLYDGSTTYTNNQGDINDFEITFNSTSSKTFTYECQCDNIDANAKCTQQVTSRVDPPTVTCPTTHYEANPNEQISFTPDALNNCDIGCNYTIVKEGATDPSASKIDKSYKTRSAIPFPGDNVSGATKKYTFTVDNGKEPAGSCDFYVDYSKPEIDCPTSGWSVNAEPGEQVQISANITGCSNCTYKVKRSGISDISASYSSGKISFTSESSAEDRDYTLEVSNGAPGGTASCPIHVAYYKPEIECPSTSEFTVEPGATFTYPISGKVKYCSSNCAYTVTGGLSPSTDSYTGGSITLASESNGSSSKTYSFNVSNGLTASNSCTIKVNYKSPEIVCPTSTISVEPGGTASYDPGVSNCEQGCKYTISNAGSPLPESITEYTYTGGIISFVAGGSATPDTYSLTVTNKAGQSASVCDFSVGYKVPTFTCPTVSGSKATGSDVTVTPTNVQNCTNGCTYSIEPVYNGSGTASGTYRSDRELGPVTENSAGTTTYALHLINAAGQDTRNCTFDVEYRAAACAEINWTISGDNGNLNSEPIENPECVTINTSRYCTGEVQIKVAGCKNKPGKWNGNSFTFDAGNPAYKQYGSNPTPRLSNTLELPDRCGSSLTMYMTGCIDLNYASSAPVITCPTSTKTLPPGGSVSIPVSNCRVIGGCNYMITATGTTPKQGNGIIANSISFTGESATNTYNYTMNVSNSEGDATPCNFTVKYDANSSIPITVGYQDYKFYEANKTYELTMAGGGVFRCTYSGWSSGFTVGTFNGSSWSAGANTGGQVTASNPGAGTVVTFTVGSNIPDDLKCANDW